MSYRSPRRPSRPRWGKVGRGARSSARAASGAARRTGTAPPTASAAARRRRAWRRRTKTSPGPTPAKHTRSDHGPRTSPPRCTVTASPGAPAAMSAFAHASPTQCAARAMSSSHSGSSRGTTRSTQVASPGSMRTAPPPLRRRTTSTPARRHASTSTPAIDWVEPRTSAGPSTSKTHAVRSTGSGSSRA